jgi:hypothetical protein
MEKINIYVAWISMICGAVVGALSGLFFHKQEWFGGYHSWQRRMLRLGHIALFGIAFINFAFVFTVFYFNISQYVLISGTLLIIGTISMPLVCFLSAYKKFFRHLFFIPVLSIIAAMVIFVIGGMFL